MPSKKEKKIKIFTSEAELYKTCDDLVKEIRHIFIEHKNESVKIIMDSFVLSMAFLKKHYFDSTKIKKECQKQLFEFVTKLNVLVAKYKKNPTSDMKITIGTEVENFLNILKRCYLPTQQQLKEKQQMPYNDKIKKILIHVIRALQLSLKETTGRNSDDFDDNVQFVTNLRKFIFNQKKRQYSAVELTDIFTTLFSNMSNFSGLLVEDLSGDNPEIASYIHKLLCVWTKNVKKDFDPNAMNIDRNTLGFVGLTILKRVMLACLLILEGQTQLFMGYIRKLEPSLEDLDIMAKRALKLTRERRLYTPLMWKLRSQLENKRLTTPSPSQATSTSSQPSEQQVRQWQQRLSAFIHQLEKQQQQQQQQQHQQQRRGKRSQKKCQILSQYQVPPQSSLQKEKQKNQSSFLSKPDFVFQYKSPHYRHRNDFRVATEQNLLLRQRKNRNIHQVQSSIIDQSLPLRVMEVAIQGGYSSILLIDVANKHKQLYPQQHQQKVVSAVKKIIPWDVPQTARKKPLYVFIEQGDLDSSHSPKAVIDDRLLKQKNILQIKVSCVKETKDGRLTDCYKKQGRRQQQQFTKNPMDDFVLLTLKYALRSYYHQYMKHIGNDVKMLKKLETLEDIISQNPYEILLQQQDIGQIVQQTYKNITFDKSVPYTWAISGDRWRDWMRQKR